MIFGKRLTLKDNLALIERVLAGDQNTILVEVQLDDVLEGMLAFDHLLDLGLRFLPVLVRILLVVILQQPILLLSCCLPGNTHSNIVSIGHQLNVPFWLEAFDVWQARVSAISSIQIEPKTKGLLRHAYVLTPLIWSMESGALMKGSLDSTIPT